MFLKIKKVIIISTVLFASYAMVVFQKHQKIFMAGDSTMANKKPNKYPETGWGQVFSSYFTSDVEIFNYAVNGASTKSFIKNKNWDKLVSNLGKGDYVFIQFGHNDERLDKTDRGTTLDEYETNLTQFVFDVKNKKAIPILLSPVMRRSIKEDKFYNTHLGYDSVVCKVARDQKVAFIDMLNKSKKLLESLGIEESKTLFLHVNKGDVNYPNGKRDNTHFNPVGANKIARLAVQGIKELNLPLSAYLK